jgi:Uma2 family endonuclease
MMATSPMSQPTRATPGEWTYSEYARLPDDGNRYEVLDGEVLVTPAPTPHHQKVILRLAMLLLEYVDGRDAGWVFQDVDLLFASGHFLRPDLVVVAKDGREGITDRGVEVPPVLVVEVLSPSSGAIDRVKKPRRYLDFGVPAYWVVDPVEGAVWIWDPGAGPDAPVREDARVRWSHPEGAPALEVDVAALVAPI